MNRLLKPLGLAIAVTALGAPGAARAQQAAAQQPPLEVGAVAPDFALPGATRFGLLQQPVRLSDYRGKTVVLAFYFRSRTRG
jgi:hypothetical protein